MKVKIIPNSKKKTSIIIVLILILSFSTSFLIRVQPSEFGFELNEYDPFFNYRATKYLVENGLSNYLNWNDDLSWHPYGRDVSATSQVMLHLITGVTYYPFSKVLSLYDFTILFPAIVGSLTTIVIFALVRILTGTTSGLFASLLFAISPHIIIRGTVGWYKSEPLGIFFGLLSLFLFFSALQKTSQKYSIIKLIGAGIVFGFGISSWGGTMFFLFPLMAFFIALPFFNKNIWYLFGISIFVASIFLTSIFFERSFTLFVTGISGMALIGAVVIMFSFYFLKSSKLVTLYKTYLSFGVVGLLVIFGIFFVQFGVISLPYERYVVAVIPFFETTNPLIASVNEHRNFDESYLILSSTLIVFSILGLLFIIKPPKLQNISKIPTEIRIFTIVICLIGIFVSVNFIRLLVFQGLALVILSAIGIGYSSHLIFRHFNKQGKNSIFTFFFIGLLLFLIIIPSILPSDSNWVTMHRKPPTILVNTDLSVSPNGDWFESLHWLRDNTNNGSVIAAWWDYGYWISTIAERKTLSDGATFAYPSIQITAKAFLSPPEEGLRLLKQSGADYILIHLDGFRLPLKRDFMIFNNQGDQSKVFHFARIAGYEPNDFFENNNLNQKFWNETLLGKLLPINEQFYYNPFSKTFSNVYFDNSITIYEIAENKKNDLIPDLELIYTSSSLKRESAGTITSVLIYQIKD